MIQHSSTSQYQSPSRFNLFKIVCISLFTTLSVGFVQQHSLSRQQVLRPVVSSNSLATEPLHIADSTRDVQSPASKSQATSKGYTNLPRLTIEQEQELLRQAVEYRRLNRLEQELALQSPTHKLPLLSIRAKNAGYGTELDLYEDAMYQGQKAREMLVTHNMGLVHWCVNNIIGKESKSKMNTNAGIESFPTTNAPKKLPLNSLSREDLTQEGAIGLARAVDKWNPSIGGKFSTYAVYWIRAAVLRCIAERDDMLRVPNHVSQAVSKINKAAQRLGLDLDSTTNSIMSNSRNSMSWKEATAAKRLAEEAGLSESNFNEAMKARSRRYSGGYIPFETWMQKGKNLQGDTATVMHSIDTNSDDGSSTEELRTVLSKFLRPKEMEALSWRYGLLKDDNNMNSETPQERANRQFSEMENELFGSSPLAATSAATVVTAGKSQAQNSDMFVVKGKFGEAMSFTEVGKRMQVSAEYTRKLCHKALDKLRQAADDGRLEPALLM